MFLRERNACLRHLRRLAILARTHLSVAKPGDAKAHSLAPTTVIVRISFLVITIVYCNPLSAGTIYSCQYGEWLGECLNWYLTGQTACNDLAGVFNRHASLLENPVSTFFATPYARCKTEYYTNGSGPFFREDQLDVANDDCAAEQSWNETIQQCEFVLDDGKNRGACEGESCCLGNPISAGGGWKYQTETDVTLTSLTFERSYNSTDLQLNGAPTVTTLGKQWAHIFERRVIVDNTNTNAVNVTRPDGKSYRFALSGNQWNPDGDVGDRL